MQCTGLASLYMRTWLHGSSNGPIGYICVVVTWSAIRLLLLSGGLDYNFISRQLILHAFQKSSCFKLVPIDDDVLEDHLESLTLVISLATPSDRVYLQQASLDVMIMDDDGK